MSGPAVAPGTGWPGDVADAATPVAGEPADVERLAASAQDLTELVARQSVCRACPRLVSWRESVAVHKRRAFADQRYWGRPVPGWGDERPGVLIVGLAPAAHGGNRTGRIFTGDRSGDWLFAALHRCGLATAPTSTAADDGQHLIGVRVVAAVRCAPPDNKPTTVERDACAPWLRRELDLARGPWGPAAIVVLGGFGWQALWPALRTAGFAVPRPRPAFGHGVEVHLSRPGGPEVAGRDTLLLGCYHPSQQNTFTGRLTEPMLDAVLTRAKEYAAIG